MADSTTSGAIHFTGLGNGTDFESIIQAMVQAKSVHKTRLQKWQAEWYEKQDQFEALNTKMVELKSHMQTMDSPDEFFKKTVASSDTSVATATANSTADEGSHTIVVSQVARTDIKTNQSTNFTSKTDVVTGADAVLEFDYKSGALTTETLTLNIPANTTLEGLKNIINNDASNPGIRASIVYDGSEYYMQVAGRDLGLDYTVDITANTTLTDFAAADWTESQTSQNAQLTADGLSVDIASNTITEVIEGLTINLKAAGTTVISVNNDKEAIQENVTSFINKVNEVRQALLDLTKFDEQLQRGAILQGNYGLQLISSKIKDATAGKGIGFDYDDDTISTLSQIGITTDAEEGSASRGLLIFDAVTFFEKLDEDSDSVAQIFSAYYEGETNSPDFLYNSHISGMTEAGTYDVEYTTDAGGNITSATIGGYAATVSGTSITGPADTPVAGLGLTAINTTPSSTFTGEVRLKLGKAGEMVETLEELTHANDGPLNILGDNYQDIIDNIQDKIDYETERITNSERTLRLKFARLEATLNRYDNLKTSLESQLKNLKPV